jgi:radical SAM/Cys-rich protein
MDTASLPDLRPFPALSRGGLSTLQVNLGYRCNQACRHCHVDAGPQRTEMMDRATVGVVLEFLRARRISQLDLTGGAPELNPHFRYLVSEARRAGATVIDRCNLTILSEPGQETLARFLAEQGVHVIASLPCHSAENVEQQRGRGVFERSLVGLRQLNALGYAATGSELTLDLVYNPQGAVLPPDPEVLEADYKRELAAHGVAFNRLLTLANMPIARFRHDLERDGLLDGYMALLEDNYQPGNLPLLMCRSLISVDYRGQVYDCDFNQMLGLPLGACVGARQHLSDLLDEDLEGRPIAVDRHCFGCAAGRGSSCGGALSI